MGIGAIFYSSVTNIPLAIGLVMVVGFMNAPAMISGRLLTQRNTERGIRGRVISVFTVVKNIAFLLGMAAAGLADVIDIRLMMLVSALIIFLSGVLTMFLPGLRQSAEEWRRATSLLLAAPAVPALSPSRAATLADFDTLLLQLPVFAQLNQMERVHFIEGTQIQSVPTGSMIIKRGEPGESAFFILAGRTVAGISTAAGGVRTLSIMTVGDFFGEISALMGVERTADVVAEEETTLMQVPAENLKRTLDHPRLHYLFLSKVTERINRTHVTDLPRLAGFDQEVLRDLRMTAIDPEDIPDQNDG